MPTSWSYEAIYLGNLPDMDPDETGGAWYEDAHLALGTYGSGGDPLYDHVVQMTSVDGGDNGYLTSNADDTMDYDLNDGNGLQSGQFDSMIGYYGVVTYADGSTDSGLIYLHQDANGNVFLMPEPAGFWPGNGGMNIPDMLSKGVVSIQLNSVAFQSSGGMGVLNYQNNEFVCFATGTAIRTPSGNRPIEELGEGDLVETLDHEAQPILWHGARTLTFPGAPDSQKPLRIKAGVAAEGVPARDLVLSPSTAF